MSNTYKLSTLKDIFDKVPADKIEECCKELGELLAQTARMRDAVAGEMEMYGIIIPESGLVSFPESVEWIDDGLGDLTVNVGLRSESGDFHHLFSVETKAGDTHDSKTSTDKP